jgi:hypothetical protein
MWKKWFNNRAMNRLERRLGREDLLNRSRQNGRYEMRKLKPKEVSTKEARDNYSREYWSYAY